MCHLDLKYTLLHLKHGDIKGTTAEIIDGDNWWVISIKTIGQSGSCGLIDDTEVIVTGNLTCVFDGFLLSVIEVRWDSDDGVAE